MCQCIASAEPGSPPEVRRYQGGTVKRTGWRLHEAWKTLPKRLGELVLASLLVVVRPPEASAQTPPEPTAPGQIPAISLGGVDPAPGAGGWTLSLNYGADWSDNPRFVAFPRGQADRQDSFGAGLSRGWSGRRTQISLSGQGAALFYRDGTVPSSFDYSGATSGSRRLSSRATLILGGSVSSNSSGESPELMAAGLLLPLARVRSLNAMGSYSYKASSYSTFSASAAYYRVNFEANAGVTPLVDGSTLSTSASWTRKRRSSALGIAYIYERSVTPSPANIHTLTGIWSGTSFWKFDARARIGASLLAVPSRTGSATPRVTPNVALSLTPRVQGYLPSVQFSQSISQAYGLGRQRVANLFSTSWNKTLTRRVGLTASYTYSHSDDPQDRSFSFESETFDAGLDYSLWKLSLGGGYSLRRFKEAFSPMTQSQGGRASISFQTSWGGSPQRPGSVP
jgi:hypothetical protein